MAAPHRWELKEDLGARNAPTVWNSVFQTSQFWDGRAASLEEQAAGLLVAQPEMGMPNHDVVIERIKAIPGYVSEFREVFGDNEPVTIDTTVKAIAAFERTLITPNSAYDRFTQGDKPAMTAQQLRGMKLFDSDLTGLVFPPNLSLSEAICEPPRKRPNARQLSYGWRSPTAIQQSLFVRTEIF